MRGNKMLEKILSPDNLNLAYTKVAQNKGTYGIDGMTTEQLLPFLEAHGESLRQSLLDGSYIPQPVRAVRIPKGGGKFRTLGIPTAIDRFIQRAVVQVLMPLYDAEFSEASYGFRPERSVEDAVKKCLNYINNGFTWAADMDLEKFFDSVCREKLMEILIKDIQDDRVTDLIGAYINSGIIEDGRPSYTSTGIHQGGPLSPLLANIMLNELDSELTRRHENFVRYADDMIIFCRNKPSAYQALKHIAPYIEGNLLLRINEDKTALTHVDNVKFLGYGFFRTPNGYRIRIHEDSVANMKERIIELAGKDESKIRQYIAAWIAHYRLADIVKFLNDNEDWIGDSLMSLFVNIWLSQQERIDFHPNRQ